VGALIGAIAFPLSAVRKPQNVARARARQASISLPWNFRRWWDGSRGPAILSMSGGVLISEARQTVLRQGVGGMVTIVRDQNGLAFRAPPLGLAAHRCEHPSVIMVDAAFALYRRDREQALESPKVARQTNQAPLG
jgi:hypothetical protein